MSFLWVVTAIAKFFRHCCCRARIVGVRKPGTVGRDGAFVACCGHGVTYVAACTNGTEDWNQSTWDDAMATCTLLVRNDCWVNMSDEDIYATTQLNPRDFERITVAEWGLD